jgi:hypothetical protein
VVFNTHEGVRVTTRVLYQDRTAALTDEAVVLRGFTRLFGRSRRVQLTQITSFHLRPASEYPNEQIPRWGVDDRGVWFTRDARRWRRRVAVELTFANGERVGFTPAHPNRFRELLMQLGVNEA